MNYESMRKMGALLTVKVTRKYLRSWYTRNLSRHLVQAASLLDRRRRYRIVSFKSFNPIRLLLDKEILIQRQDEPRLEIRYQ